MKSYLFFVQLLIFLVNIKDSTGRVTFQNAPGGVLVLSTMEGLPINSTLATLTATTDEVGKTVYYSLTSRTYLDIDSLTGRLYNTVVLDAESVDYINVIAEAYTDPAKKTTLQVFVEIGDINDNKPLFSKDHYIVNIKEDIVVGGFVTRLTAYDADDGGYVLSYHFDNEHPKFRINQVSGTITTKENLDHESVKQYNLTIIASDKELSSSTFLTINVLDVDDLGPVFNQSVYNASITEGSYGNEVFLVQVHAYDEDLTLKHPIVFSLEKETIGSATLRINSSTGEIYVTGHIDREEAESWHIPVWASSTNHAAVSAIVNLHVVDVNEYKPYFPEALYTGSVPENSAIGTFVMTVTAADKDKNTLRYWITNVDDSFPFRITNDGEILVNGPIDRETKNSYSFKVLVEEADTQQKYNHETSVQITVTDVNDNIPVFPNASVTLSLYENTAASVFLYQFRASDRDIGTNALIVYAISTSSNPIETEGFAVNTTGSLYSIQSFDRETKSKYNFEVTARNQHTETGFASIMVTVDILNVNDNSPVFEEDYYEAEVIESVSPGAVVIRVKAEDRDLGTTRLLYSIVNGSNGDFVINADSGIITTSKSLNRELYNSYNLTLKVSDEGNNFDFCTLHVKVVDINDNGPVFENSTGYHFRVLENQKNAFVGKVKATDKDIGLAGVVHYQLNNQHFRINETTGDITTIQALDRETRGEHVFTVAAKDLAIDFRISTVQVTVTVIDVNDNRPIFVADKTYSTVVQKSVALHTTLFTFKAIDEDVGDNGIVWYTSNQIPNFLLLDKISGDLKVSAPIPEAVEPLRITVEAANIVAPFQKDTATLDVVFVSHKIDAPTFSQSVYQAFVDENAQPNTQVIDLDATYENQPENENFVYTITHGDLSAFSIHQEHGSIATLTSLDREHNSKYTLIVSVALKGRESSNFATVNIEVRDKNDNPPVFESHGPFQLDLKENLELIPSSWKCQDSDIGNNAAISYKVNGSDLVFINAETGDLKLTKPFDYESDPHVINITITCINNDGDPQLHSSVDVSLMIKDVNDNAPVFSQTEYTVEIQEFEGSSTSFVFNATDKDEGINGRISYRMKSVTPVSDCFQVEPSTGKLSVSCSLDRENVSRYLVEVEARDSGTPLLSTIVRINIVVADVNDQLPVFTKTEFSFSFPENRQPSEVGRLDVTDGDVGQPCQYCVIHDGDNTGSFYITGDGTIYSNRTLDRELKDVYKLTVRAYMHHWSIPNNPFSNCTVTIRITDENDNPPVLQRKNIVTGVLNSSPYGGIVTTLTATDDDTSSKTVFTVTSGNTENNFFVDSATGIITTVRDIVARTSSVFTLTIDVTNKDPVVSNAVKKDNATVHIVVFDENSLVKFSVAQNESYVRENKIPLENFLSNTTQYYVTIHQIESATAETSRAKVSCYGIDTKQMKLVARDKLFSSLRNNSLFNSFWNITPIEDDGSSTRDENAERQLLIGIILGVSVLVVGLIMLAIFLWLRGEQRKRKRPNKAMNDDLGVSYKDNGGFIPNGTRYYVEPYESSDMYGSLRSNNAADDDHLPKTFYQDPNDPSSFPNPVFDEEDEDDFNHTSKTGSGTNIENGVGRNAQHDRINGGNQQTNQRQETEDARTNANANRMVTSL